MVHNVTGPFNVALDCLQCSYYGIDYGIEVNANESLYYSLMKIHALYVCMFIDLRLERRLTRSLTGQGYQ